MNLLLIACLLLFGPLLLITECTGVSKLKTSNLNAINRSDEVVVVKRNLSVKHIFGSLSQTHESYEKSGEDIPLPKEQITTTTAESENTNSNSEDRYKSLVIVWSVSAVIVLGIGLTALYIQYKEGGNKSNKENHRRDGFQLNSISNINMDLDIQSGTQYLNRGIIAFNDITSEILAHNNNTNTLIKT